MTRCAILPFVIVSSIAAFVHSVWTLGVWILPAFLLGSALRYTFSRQTPKNAGKQALRSIERMPSIAGNRE